MRVARLLLLAGAAFVAGAGAGATAQPVTELHVTDGALPPAERLIRATQGDTLRWHVSSNRAGELHLHAYRVSAVVQPDKAGELAFKAHAAGRFRVEWHASDAAGLAAAGDSGAHHAPPLAVLEVRPR